MVQMKVCVFKLLAHKLCCNAVAVTRSQFEWVVPISQNILIISADNEKCVQGFSPI